MTAQLPQILIRNSFNILGLSSSSALKEIRKRSQQLFQLAKIEEVQEYDIDIGPVKEFRNESEIRLALERISGIKERLKEVFFWFEDHSIESRKAISLISKKDYKQALDIFEKAELVQADWLGRKNLAMALMFHAFASSSIDSFINSLNLWKFITESDDFWKFYEKHYLLHDELDTSSSLFEEFRSSVYEVLSDKAVSFYHQTKYSKVIGTCYSVLGRIGKTLDVEVLQPIILKVKKEVEELAKIDPKSKPDADMIGLILKKIHIYFLELDRFELSEYSSLTILKNDTAENLRSISVDLYNQNVDCQTAIMILNQSSKLAISKTVADKIQKDIKQLGEIKAWHSVSDKFEQIKSLIDNQKIEEAKNFYLSIDNELARRDGEPMTSTRVLLLIHYCSLLIKMGHDLFNKNKFDIEALAISSFINAKTRYDAVRAFKQAREILTDRLYLFKFVNPAADRVALSKIIDDMSSDFKNWEIAVLVDRHQSYLQKLEDFAHQQVNENTQIALKLLGATIYFSIFYERFQEFARGKIWKWIGWVAVIFFYFFVIMDNDKPKTSKKISYESKSSYSSSSQQLTYKEKEIIEFLEKNEPDVLRDIRKKGYSDKQIAQYALKYIEDEKK